MGNHDQKRATLLSVQGYHLLPFDRLTPDASGRLAPHHGDPFDRMLIAQAIKEKATVVTNNSESPLRGISG